jgi:hypothetical protein
MICKYHLIFTGDKDQKNEMGWSCVAYVYGVWVFVFLMGKQEGRSPLRTPRLRCVNNNMMDVQEV